MDDLVGQVVVAMVVCFGKPPCTLKLTVLWAEPEYVHAERNSMW